MNHYLRAIERYNSRPLNITSARYIWARYALLATPALAIPMRILVHAFERPEGWIVQCLTDDARTTVAPQSRVPSFETVLRLLRYVGATGEAIAEMERDHRRWGIGSVRVDLIPGRKNLLRVRAPWNEGLVDS